MRTKLLFICIFSFSFPFVFCQEKPVQKQGVLRNYQPNFMLGFDVLNARLGVDFSATVSCYRADADGRACGHCDACVLRARGFAEAGVADPTHYVPGA